MARTLVRYLAIIAAFGFAGPFRASAQLPPSCLTPGGSNQSDCSNGIANALSSTNRLTPLQDGWTLVRTKLEIGSPEQISIMHQADTASNIGLAGISLRCAANGVDVMLVVLEPVPPGTHPSITIAANGQQRSFDTSVLPGRRSLRLLPQAEPLPTPDWLQSHTLSVKVELGPSSVHGVLPIDGMIGALQTLRSACSAR